MTPEEIKDYLDKRKYKELKDVLEDLHPVDIAELLEEFNDDKQIILAFRLLAKEDAAEVFTYLNSDMQETLINALTDSELEEIMEEMYLDDTADILEEMPANVVDRLLMMTDEETRKQINILLNYPEDSAGSIMNVDYIGLRKDMTVGEAILKIRQVGLNRETIYTCYVTEKRKLIGVVDVKDLLTTGDNTKIEEIMDTATLFAYTHDDQEDVATSIKKYGLVAMPIVDYEQCMVGIVTVDDAMMVLQEEATEDISVMAGMSPNEDDYFGTSVLKHAKNRCPWLLFLMLSATFSGLALDHYAPVLAAMPILNTFVPMLTGTGGNCGSQSSTLMIRGISVGEIEFKDIFKVMFKELRIALVVGVFLAIANGIRVVIMYDQPMLAFVLGLTLVAVVCIAKLIGCVLPMAAKKCGLDPALMAAPLISTILDTTTVIVYFTIASRIFHI